MTPYATAAIKQVKAKMKQQAKKERKQQSQTTVMKSAAATAIDARVRKIVELQRQVLRKSLSDEERRGVAGELLREKLAACEEVALARAGQMSAIANAQGMAINRPHNPRTQTHAPYTRLYTREAPERSRTELASQVTNHTIDSAVRMQGLERALRQAQKARDSLAVDRISQDITFFRLADAHGRGLI